MISVWTPSIITADCFVFAGYGNVTSVVMLMGAVLLGFGLAEDVKVVGVVSNEGWGRPIVSC